MDMNTDEKAMCGGGGDLPLGPAENHYEHSQDLGNYSGTYPCKVISLVEMINHRNINFN